MKIETREVNNVNVAIIESEDIIIQDVQSALDFIATVSYETNSSACIINKTNVIETFFDLKNGIAGEILQKFTNYNMKIAIIGDYSIYNSKSLKDFIYESNKGKNILFVENKEEAIKKLSNI